MAEENIENQEQTTALQQHSREEVKRLAKKIKELDRLSITLTKAIRSKEVKEAKKSLKEQEIADSKFACDKFKLDQSEAVEAIKEVNAKYEADFKEIKDRFEQEHEALVAKQIEKEDEQDTFLMQEAKARKAYREAKKTREYADFVKAEKKNLKDIEFYENDKYIDPEAAKKILEGLRESAPKNPLNKYAETLKTIEENKKKAEQEKKQIEAEIKDLETRFERAWDELDVKKNKALVEVKKDIVKPTFKQKMINFFNSKSKRKEMAKEEMKKKGGAALGKVAGFFGGIGTGIAKKVSDAKESIKAWDEKRKQENQERLNKLYDELETNYQEKQEEVDILVKKGYEIVGEQQGKVINVPESKEQIYDADDSATTIEYGEAEIETAGTVIEGINSTSSKEAETAEDTAVGASVQENDNKETLDHENEDR